MILDLPFDLNIYILDFLSYNEIVNLKDIFKDLLYYSIKQKFSCLKKNKIDGLINNLFNKCYKCKIILAKKYNINTCINCSFTFNKKVKYPKICFNCSEYLSRGRYKFIRCVICNKLSFHLGIENIII